MLLPRRGTSLLLSYNDFENELCGFSFGGDALSGRVLDQFIFQTLQTLLNITNQEMLKKR